MAISPAAAAAAAAQQFAKNLTNTNLSMGVPPGAPITQTVQKAAENTKELGETKQTLTETQQTLTTTQNNLNKANTNLNNANSRISALEAEIDRLEKSAGGQIKVSAYSPYEPAVSGISQTVVSGLTPAGSEDDGDYVDYSSANGTYLVTPETEKEPDPFKRVYKHSSEEWYIWASYEDYGDGYIEATWYIGPAADSGSLGYWTDGDLTSGSCTFEDWDWGFEFQVTLAVTKTDYPEVPMVLSGKKSTGYNPASYEYTWEEEQIEFSAFNLGRDREEPQPYRIYAVSGDTLLGSYLHYDGADLKTLSLVHHAFASPSDTADSGQTFVDYVQDETNFPKDERYQVIDGIPCMGHNNSNLLWQEYSRTIDVPEFDAKNGATLIVSAYVLEADKADTRGDTPLLAFGRDGFLQNMLDIRFTGGDGEGITGAAASNGWGRVSSQIQFEPGWHQLVAILRPAVNRAHPFLELWVDGEFMGTGGDGTYGNINKVVFYRDGAYFERGEDNDRGGYIADSYAVSRALDPSEIKYTWNKFKSRITK